MRQGDLRGADEFLTAALERRPYHVGLQAELGNLYLSQGLETEGLDLLERSCSGWPEAPECAVYAARYYVSRGRWPEARQAADEALRRDPESWTARLILDRLRTER